MQSCCVIFSSIVYLHLRHVLSHVGSLTSSRTHSRRTRAASDWTWPFHLYWGRCSTYSFLQCVVNNLCRPVYKEAIHLGFNSTVQLLHTTIFFSVVFHLRSLIFLFFLVVLRQFSLDVYPSPTSELRTASRCAWWTASLGSELYERHWWTPWRWMICFDAPFLGRPDHSR